jgi:hypothetical protein
MVGSPKRGSEALADTCRESRLFTALNPDAELALDRGEKTWW